MVMVAAKVVLVRGPRCPEAWGLLTQVMVQLSIFCGAASGVYFRTFLAASYTFPILVGATMPGFSWVVGQVGAHPVSTQRLGTLGLVRSRACSALAISSQLRSVQATVPCRVECRPSCPCKSSKAACGWR